jgi:hypothetical protein
MEQRRRGVYVSLVILILLIIPALSLGAEITVTPALDLRGEYNDNVLFTPTDAKSDYIGIVTPSLAIDYKTEKSLFQARATLEIYQYAQETELNTVNQYYDAKADFMATEHIRVRGNAAYIHDTTLDSELRETGIVTTLSLRSRALGGGGLSYVGERSEIGVDYRYTKTDYQDPSLVDYVKQNAELTYSYKIGSPRDIVTIMPLFIQFDSDVSTVNSYGVTLGWSHQFTETFMVSLSAGPVWSDVEQKSPKMTDDVWDVLGEFSLRKKWETSSLTAGYRRELANDSIGETIMVNQFFLTAEMMLTSRFGVGARGDYYITKSISIFNNENQRYAEVSPYLKYNLTEEHFLQLQYSYSTQDDKTVPVNSTSDRNRVWLSLNFRFPKKW